MKKKLFCFNLAEGVTHSGILPIKAKFGFTLAEVLITLGIIGVVAAMTIPNLMTKIYHIDTASKLKKFYSTMKQALMSAEDEFGPVVDWDSNLPAKEYVQKYFGPFLKFTLDTEYAKDNVSSARVYLMDGTSVTIRKGRCMDFEFDVNGLSKPNVRGKDQFVFLACDKSISEWCAEEGFCTYRKSDMRKQNSREVYLNECKRNPSYCSALLEYDGWKFEKDYPYFK